MIHNGKDSIFSKVKKWHMVHNGKVHIALQGGQYLIVVNHVPFLAHESQGQDRYSQKLAHSGT